MIRLVAVLLVVGTSAMGKTMDLTNYSGQFVGKAMANGKIFTGRDGVCASRTMPLGTTVLIRRGFREVRAVITDRTARRVRALDCDRRVFRQLAALKEGRVVVEVAMVPDDAR